MYLQSKINNFVLTFFLIKIIQLCKKLTSDKINSGLFILLTFFLSSLILICIVNITSLKIFCLFSETKLCSCYQEYYKKEFVQVAKPSWQGD